MTTTAELELVTSLYRASNAVVRGLDQRLERAEQLTFVQAFALVAISRLERPQPKHVAERLGTQTQTLTGLLDRLERAGYVERLRDLGDRRAVRLELTNHGRKLAGRVAPLMERSAAELVGGVGAKRAGALQVGLDELNRLVNVAALRR